MNILFDSLGSQPQIQAITLTRLNTLRGAMASFGYSIGKQWSVAFSDWQQPLKKQLDGVDVLVILTRHRATYPGLPPAVPPSTDFAFPVEDLDAIQAWVEQGNGLVHISNHGPMLPGNDTDWTIYDAPLAARFGVTIVPAGFTGEGPLVMTPAEGAPAPIKQNVSTIVAHNSCGVQAKDGVTIAALPAGVVDRSGHDYNPADYVYATTVEKGFGSVIVAGNSGIAGDLGNDRPAEGTITLGSNLQFLLNCIAFVGA
jgi:hypothetical protein